MRCANCERRRKHNECENRRKLRKTGRLKGLKDKEKGNTGSAKRPRWKNKMVGGHQVVFALRKGGAEENSASVQKERKGHTS